MNILVLFTGGTIGSSIQDGLISLKEDNKYKLIKMYREKTGDGQEFDVDTPYTVLSENLNGTHITKLVRSISGHLKGRKYNGIIITHGTDTLPYMAAALSIIFENADIPILLVSSNYPLEDKRANGLSNFIKAVRYIQGKRKSGIYVSYKNRGEDEKIIRPDLIVNYDIYSDVIRRIEEGPKTTSVEINPDEIVLQETSPIKFIRPYPGIQYEIPGDDIKAILFGSYHSGTINTAGSGLREFCEILKRKNVSLYICGVPEGVGYESTKYYKEFGINVLPYGTDIYWYMRLWIEYSKGNVPH